MTLPIPRQTISLLMLGAGLLFCGAVHSQHPEPLGTGDGSVLLLPGYWEIVTRPELLGGGPMMVLPRSARLCLDSMQIAIGNIGLSSMPGCSVSPEGRWEGSTLKMAVSCASLPPEGRATAEIQAAGQTFLGRTDIVFQPSKDGPERSHFIYRHTGRRVAEKCPDAPSSARP